MKKYFLVLWCFAGLQVMAQHTPKVLKEHALLVKGSKEKNTALRSLDTLFCSGLPVATVVDSALVEVAPGVSIKPFIVNALRTGERLIIINEVYDLQFKKVIKPGDKHAIEEITPYYLFSFPALNQACNVKPDKGKVDMYATICKYGLINDQALLDTVRAETFVTLKGRIDQNQRRAPVAEKAYILKRNKKAPLTFEGENIMQDGLMIGVVKQDSVPGPAGPLRIYSIFNITGAQICTATQAGSNSHDWRLLTYRDNSSFHSMTAVSGNDLEEILRFLITGEFL